MDAFKDSLVPKHIPACTVPCELLRALIVVVPVVFFFSLIKQIYLKR